jgi:glycosyltransferase involved in cell wall biosynthesis
LPNPVAFVLKGYPRLSETFIAQEILELERRGLDIRIVSLRQPYDKFFHPIHDQIKAPVTYLPEYLHLEPFRVLRAWWTVRRRRGYRVTRALWWRDLKRDVSRNRVRRFGQALVLAHELDDDVASLHAHFLHTPASVARYCAHLSGLGWSCSAHAKDIWTTPEWEKREKLADVEWLVTCSSIARDHLQALAPPDSPAGLVDLVYHGIDLGRFPMQARESVHRDGSSPEQPVRLLSVGRAVAKKGYDDLIDALARLPQALHWRLEHIGGGPLAGALRKQARRAGIEDRIDWRGPQSQEEVLSAYRRADVFVLASRVADDGDRDGLPNVLLEASSQGLACVASNVSAIPELIDDDVSGLLVPQCDPPALSVAIAGLISDPERRGRLGQAACARVARDFAHDRCILSLAEKFSLPVTSDDDAASQRLRA